MPLYTLTYDEGVSGWPSFYTFYPIQYPYPFNTIFIFHI